MVQEQANNTDVPSLANKALSLVVAPDCSSSSASMRRASDTSLAVVATLAMSAPEAHMRETVCLRASSSGVPSNSCDERMIFVSSRVGPPPVRVRVRVRVRVLHVRPSVHTEACPV